MTPEYKERLEKFLDRVISVATYTRATLPHPSKYVETQPNFSTDPEWTTIHKGRSGSAHNQLTDLLKETEMLKSGLKEDPKPCKCGQPGRTERPCPYESEINANPASYCNCCESCMQNCLDDI